MRWQHEPPVPQTFDELLATAKAVKTTEMSGIAMRAPSRRQFVVPAMSFLFSYGGQCQGQQRRFASPSDPAVEMYGQLLSNGRACRHWQL